MSKDEAIQCGAQALFGEKYGDVVRVVRMGEFSTELCGGTHLNSTAEISHFLIQSESALSSGIRRIEALTSSTAIQYLQKRSSILTEIEQRMKVKGEKTITRYEQLVEDSKKQQKEIKSLNDQLEATKSATLFQGVEKIGDLDYKLVEVDADTNLKNMGDLFADKYPQGVLIAYAKTGAKFKALIKVVAKCDLDAGKILKESLAVAGGRGGGRKDMAQGSGDSSKISEFTAKVTALIKG
jgi:alanyl-tRNA synthetase